MPKDAEIPYPSVFHDWEHPERRVATTGDVTGVRVEVLLQDGSRAWLGVVMTEDDAALMAASLLMRAGYKSLSRRVLKSVGRRRASRRS